MPWPLRGEFATPVVGQERSRDDNLRGALYGVRVTWVRTSIGAHRACFALLLACTLLARLLVPAGFMPTVSDGTVRISICSGMSGAPATMVMAIPGLHHGDGESGKHGKAEAPCAFAGLGLAAIGGAAPALLAAMIAFAFLLVARAIPLALPAPPARLRPPLRAPPRFT